MNQDILPELAYLQWQQDHSILKSCLRTKQSRIEIKISAKGSAINVVGLSPFLHSRSKHFRLKSSWTLGAVAHG